MDTADSVKGKRTELERIIAEIIDPTTTETTDIVKGIWEYALN